MPPTCPSRATARPPPIRSRRPSSPVPRPAERRRAQRRVALLRRARPAARTRRRSAAASCRTRRRSIRSASRSARSTSSPRSSSPAATTPTRRARSTPTPSLVLGRRAGTEVQFELGAPRIHRRSARQLLGLRRAAVAEPARPSTASSPAASTSRATPASISKPSSWSAPTIPAARTSRRASRKLPIFTTWGGTAGLGHRFNRFDVAAKGGAERTVYQDSTFTDGTTASNEDRNYNRYFTQLRGSYELTPGVKPFVEVGADRRVHDLDVDFFGLQRNSDGGYVKGGSTFELTRILTGEAAVGWLDAPLRGSDAAEDCRADLRRAR